MEDKWKPKEGEMFYLIVSTMMQSFDIIKTAYKNKMYRLKLHVKNSNCFRTKREANEMLKKIKKLLKEQQ